MVDAAAEIAELLAPGLGRLEVVDGAGHGTYHDRPEATDRSASRMLLALPSLANSSRCLISSQLVRLPPGDKTVSGDAHSRSGDQGHHHHEPAQALRGQQGGGCGGIRHTVGQAGRCAGQGGQQRQDDDNHQEYACKCA